MTTVRSIGDRRYSLLSHQHDARYALKGAGGAPVDAYTKAESDARYEPIDTMYTKAESDARYALASALAALTTRVATLEAQVATLQSQMTGHTHTSGTIDVMGGAAVMP